MDSTQNNQHPASSVVFGAEAETRSPAGSGEPSPQGTAQRRRTADQPAHRKSPAFATILSLMPGLGQVYTGYYQLGFAYAAVVAVIITAIVTVDQSGFDTLFGISLAFFWLYNLIDASRRALLFNHALETGQPGLLGQEPQILGARGSMMAGIILIVLGLLILLPAKFDVSMEWLEDWWPLLIVALGIYLVARARQSRRQSVATGSVPEHGYRK
jgi:hypothetical protein